MLTCCAVVIVGWLCFPLLKAFSIANHHYIFILDTAFSNLFHHDRSWRNEMAAVPAFIRSTNGIHENHLLSSDTFVSPLRQIHLNGVSDFNENVVDET